MQRHAVLVLALLAGAGCSMLQESHVPGTKNKGKDITKMDPIPISDVMTALKIQLGEAFEELDSIKKRHSKNPAVQGLNPRVGTGSFSGTTQLVQTDAGNVMAIIPFTGYTGSTLTPNFGLSSKATSVQSTTLSFSFDPRHEKRLGRNSSTAESLDVGSYIKDSMTAAFEQLATIPGNYEPKLTNRELKLSVTFTVLRTLNAGLGIKIVPSAPDLDSVTSNPALGSNRQQTGTYKLDLTIPLVTPEPRDPKRIIHGVVDQEGTIYLIDRPYTARFHNRHAPRPVNTLIPTKKPNPVEVEPEHPY